MLIETEQLREKLEDEIKKWPVNFKQNSAYMLSLMDFYYLERIEELFKKYFKK